MTQQEYDMKVNSIYLEKDEELLPIKKQMAELDEKISSIKKRMAELQMSRQELADKKEKLTTQMQGIMLKFHEQMHTLTEVHLSGMELPDINDIL